MKMLKSRHLRLIKKTPIVSPREVLSQKGTLELLNQCVGLYKSCITPYISTIEYNDSGMTPDTYYSNKETVRIIMYQSKLNNIVYVRAEKDNVVQWFTLKLTMTYVQKITNVWHNWQHVIYNYQFHPNYNSIAEIRKGNDNLVTWYNLVIDNNDINYSKLELDKVENNKNRADKEKYNIPILEIF